VDRFCRREGIPARIEGRIKRALLDSPEAPSGRISIEQVYDVLAVRT